METKTLLFNLKENAEDFEWYPTNDEMICRVFKDCGGASSILDIGAGDGRVLEKFSTLTDGFIDKYAIEISLMHIEKMPDDISIVGTDFRSQTLIDKKVDLVFCNPPYSEYEDWAIKIIKEANAEKVYLIIPKRWKDSKAISYAIKQRKASYKTIWSGDFSEADRQSRAKVDIVRIDLSNHERYCSHNLKTDPFDIWFDEYFAGFSKIGDDDDYRNYGEKRSEEKQRMNKIVEGQNFIEHLVNIYTLELNTLLENYKTLSKLDSSLLTEIGIKHSEVMKALRQKIEGLKNKYWEELFNHFDKITERLTSSSRKAMLAKLSEHGNVDFSADNAYAIAIWSIKNANKYLDQQLIEIFKTMTAPECVKNYKSNLRTWVKDGWRYIKNHTHYMLDYRIITKQHRAIVNDQWDASNELSNCCHDLINDIFTIANNLGFANRANSKTKYWESNKQNTFYMDTGTILAEVRAFKNGNLHLKLNQEFIKTFNVEASRLLGWIKSPREASEEMSLDIDFVIKRFGSHFLFDSADSSKLLTA